MGPLPKRPQTIGGIEMRSKDEDELHHPNLDDPRNKTYWNARGKVIRAWPHSDSEVALMDVASGEVYIFANIEVSLMETKGELIEIDPFAPMTLPLGGTTRAVKVTLEPEELKPEPTGSRLAGKYAKEEDVSIIKRCIEEGIKVNTLPRPTPGHGASAPTTHTAPTTGVLPSASPRVTQLAHDGMGVAAPRSPLTGKYARKEN